VEFYLLMGYNMYLLEHKDYSFNVVKYESLKTGPKIVLFILQYNGLHAVWPEFDSWQGQRPDWLGGPPSFLFNGYQRLFPWG
jgi:hypothetical protein